MNKTKVLIVEDEAIVALGLERVLIKFEFIVTDMISNGGDVLNSIKKNEPDIILMDINLGKGKDGIDIVKDIYMIKYIPIIYITAFDDDDTINRAVQTKPVGYILKPYKEQELKATILLGIYKNTSINDTSIDTSFKHLGFDYYFDEENKKLYLKDMLIKLSEKETKLLILLIEADGKIVLFETIENEIWGTNHVSKYSIRNVVYRIRNKMDYNFIQTIPYQGFKF